MFGEIASGWVGIAQGRTSQVPESEEQHQQVMASCPCLSEALCAGKTGHKGPSLSWAGAGGPGEEGSWRMCGSQLSGHAKRKSTTGDVMQETVKENHDGQ